MKILFLNIKEYLLFNFSIINFVENILLDKLNLYI